MDLIYILNSEENFVASDHSNEQALHLKVHEPDASAYIARHTFHDVLDLVLNDPQLEGKDRQLAKEIRCLVDDHDGRNKVLTLRAYDADGNPKLAQQPGKKGPNLDDPIQPYVGKRLLDGESPVEYLCLDVIVGLVSSIGR